jgi:hypothetical protein
MPDDETNQLLREIRDLLASQDKKYDDHLIKVQETYMQQIEINRQERKKSVRVVFLALLAVVGGIFLIMYAMK